MLGVTVGIGEGWKECAVRAAGAMSVHTGLECMVIDRWPKKLIHAYWAKLWIQQLLPREDLLFFDADLLCVKDWNPEEMLGDHDFTWCLDPSPQIPKECSVFGIDPANYGNSGLFLVRAGCPMLLRAQRLYPGCGRWPEQTAINLVAAWSTDLGIGVLPREYNRLVRKHQVDYAVAGRYDEAFNLHFVGLKGASDRLASIQKRMTEERLLCISKRSRSA